jgi:hypothetical protein
MFVSPQSLQYMLVTKRLIRRALCISHRTCVRPCLRNGDPPFVPCLSKARRWICKEDGMCVVSPHTFRSELLNELRLNLIFRYQSKSVHKLLLWLVSVRYSYSESGKRVVWESALQREQQRITNGTHGQSQSCVPLQV